jgi:RNA polymerase sigma-70 factor (ECF subfamily)
MIEVDGALEGEALSLETADALERLYDRHKTDVYRIALRYGGGRADWAEDVVQDVFIALAGALPRLHDQDALMGWLYRVTTRRCLNRLQLERFRALAPLRWLGLGLGPTSEPPRPDAIVSARTELDRALARLSELPPKERIAFAMYRLDGLTIPEIGRALGHTKGYVSKLIARAEARLLEGA